MRKPYPTDRSDAEWNYIQPHMPAPKGFGRPRIHDLREILNAVFYVLKSGCQWRLLPHEFPRACYEPALRMPAACWRKRQTKATKCNPAKVAGSLS
jgi:transposase